MPEVKLGNKYLCYSCGIKFYDLGRGEPVCPKCGANQNDADQDASRAAGAATRRKRKSEPKAKPARKTGDEELVADPAEDAEIEDLADDEIETDLVLGDDKDDKDDKDDDEEEEEDDDEEV